MILSKNMLVNSLNWEVYNETSFIDTSQTHIFAVPVQKHYGLAKKLAEEVLSDKEQDKASRLLNPKDKERYIVSKYCIRQLLGLFLNIAAENVEFGVEAFAKPTTAGLEFNISHTEDFVLLAISQKPIGIDVEYLNREFDFKSILDIGFSENEIDFIGRKEIDPLNFYSLWTRKEALLKAVGEGISDNLHQIDCLRNILKRNNQSFKMKTFFLAKDYIVSLASHHSINDLNFWIWQEAKQ